MGGLKHIHRGASIFDRQCFLANESNELSWLIELADGFAENSSNGLWSVDSNSGRLFNLAENC